MAEVLLFNRALLPNEISKLETHLQTKWLGGSLENFPVLVRLSTQSHPDFDLLSFADPTNGGDLRFYDHNHEELAFTIDEWNSSGESLVWVNVPRLDQQSRIFAYWGNDGNTTLPSYESWSDYHAVWHLDDTSDDSNNSYDTSSVGTVTTGDPGLIGGALSLSSSGYLSATTTKECSLTRLEQLAFGYALSIRVVHF